jgi:hypothetical protein
MKQLIILIGLGLFMAAGCKNKSTDTATDTATNAQNREAVVAGDVQKVWKAKRETDAQGDKDKLDRAERSERIVFFRSGKVTMTSNNQDAHGTWSISGDKLSLQIDDSDVIENFDILELDKNTMRLRAGDGSELTLKPE